MNNNTTGNALPRKTLLGNRYKIWQTIGQGGFGITYRAYDVVNNEEVVVKENLPSYCARRDSATLNVVPLGGADNRADFEKALERFYQEAKLLSRLNHPNIVRVTKAFKAAGTAFYVMPWVGGQDLRALIQNQRTPQEQFLKYVLQSLLGALDYLHQRQLLHRDIKPANILCTEEGVPILIDFGAARQLNPNRTQTTMGTPHYIPIEQQTRSYGNVGPWSDLYALGATMYALLTGSMPPTCLDRIVGKDPYVPLASMPQFKSNKQFSKQFLKSIDKALRVNPKDRWQSAREWLEALPHEDGPQKMATAYGDTVVIPATPDFTPNPRKGWMMVALVVCILIIVVLSIIIYQLA